MLDPNVVVGTKHGASEGLLLRRVERGHELMLALCVSKMCRRLLHDKRAGPVVAGAFVYEG